jgi:hypothetical protein
MSDPTKSHCPKCDGQRTCEIHGRLSVPWSWDDGQGHSVSGGDDHSLLQCRGCETVFYEKSSWNSENIEYCYDRNGDMQGQAVKTITTYPKPDSKTAPHWLGLIQKRDDELYNILLETYFAYDADLCVLSAIGIRTSLDRATEVLGIDPAVTFEEKLEALQDGGWIGSTEKDILEIVTNAGNSAAHRAWRPAASEVKTLISSLELFLQRAFIVGTKPLLLKDNLPAKPVRRKPRAKK